MVPRAQRGPVGRRFPRLGRKGSARQRDAAPLPPHAPPRGIGAVVAHAGFVAVGDVVEPAGEELECREAMAAGIGAVAAVGDELDIGAFGIVAQPRLGDGRAGGVAGDAQQALAILAGDGRPNVDPNTISFRMAIADPDIATPPSGRAWSITSVLCANPSLRWRIRREAAGATLLAPGKGP